MKLSYRRFIVASSRAQGFVETALILTVLLGVVLTMVEFGFLINSYLTLQDAARNAARFASDGQYNNRDNIHNCDVLNGTRDFYRQTGCLINAELAQERPQITMTMDSGDDIVISVFSIASPPVHDPPIVAARYPTEEGEDGWSEAKDWTGARNQSSQISSAEVQSRLIGQSPSTGYLLVEIFYNYDQRLNLPWIFALHPGPVLLHTYALMPLVSAEPTNP